MILATDYTTQTKKDLVDAVSNIHVKHPRFNKVYQLVKYCHDSTGRKRKPELLFIGGRSGVGKTTLCKHYLKDNPRQESDTTDKIPVLYIKTPIPATNHNLVEAFLVAVGDPEPFKGSIGSKINRLKKYFIACGVEIIIVDEFQQFLLGFSRPSKAMRVVSDWLKNLIEDTGIPVVLVGLPEAEIALEGNEQLNRRFTNRCNIEPFKFNNTKEIEVFKRFLKEIESRLPFPEPSEITSGDMPARIYGATGGLLAYVMDLVTYAAEYAVENDLNCITRKVFAKVFDQRGLKKVFNADENTFRKESYTYMPKFKAKKLKAEDIF